MFHPEEVVLAQHFDPIHLCLSKFALSVLFFPSCIYKGSCLDKMQQFILPGDKLTHCPQILYTVVHGSLKSSTETANSPRLLF